MAPSVTADPAATITPGVEIQELGTEVVIIGPEALRAWRERWRFPLPDREYMPRYKRFVQVRKQFHQKGMSWSDAAAAAQRKGLWDGTWAPGRSCRLTADGRWELRCSRGLVERVMAALETSLPPVITAMTEAFTTDPRVTGFRDYQRAALEGAITHGWARVAQATNAGKGAVIALLAALAVEYEGISVLICCDEVSVFDALETELREWGGLAPALVKAGVTIPPDAAVTLAMVPTLAKRLAEDPDAWRPWVAARGMLLLDEADKATAATWRRILGHATGSRWRVGFSGSFPAADTYEDLLLESLMGPVINRVRNMTLVDRGISARPSVELRPFDAAEALGRAPQGWRRLRGPERRLWAYDQAIVHNVARHAFVRSLIRADAQTVIIVNRIEHGRELCNALQGLAVFLDGSADAARRSAALEDFRAGGTRVLVVTRILDRGTNRLGYAADLIFASGEGSTRQTLQRIGRGLRRADGKAFLRLVDVVDRVPVGTFLEEEWAGVAAGYLRAGVEKRVRLYAAEGFQTRIVFEQVPKKGGRDD
jgi:superfamily II DNA or RNA helicase